MVAFAGNSLLCRAALKQTSIDAASFTFIRLLSGAFAVWLVLQVQRMLIAERTASPLVERQGDVTNFHSPSTYAPRWRDKQSSPRGRGGPFSLREKVRMRDAGNWISAAALFVYAAAFSFAYNSLSAGTGALLLFGAVQATMIFCGLRRGEKLHPIQILGLVVAVSGLIVLVFPGLSAPSLPGSMLMIGAGTAWGMYSLRGKAEKNPAGATAGNFLRAVPMAVVASGVLLPWARLDRAGIFYAVISGAITSGLGYLIWYSVLPSLKATGAATVQLSVPVLAATGGILLLSEPITLRYVLASVAVLGGIALVIMEKNRV
jgi:drug/metabolite transporter (DMT)-like permease